MGINPCISGRCTDMEGGEHIRGGASMARVDLLWQLPLRSLRRIMNLQFDMTSRSTLLRYFGRHSSGDFCVKLLKSMMWPVVREYKGGI